ncbi:hypothetical protein ACOSQ4_002748 [Xanthoceras sorbifolium]
MQDICRSDWKCYGGCSFDWKILPFREAHGPCSFSYNLGVCLADSSKYYNYRGRGCCQEAHLEECLIDFIPEVQHLIEELNEILAHDVVVDEAGMWKKKLRSQSRELLSYSPKEFRSNYCLKEIHMGMCRLPR